MKRTRKRHEAWFKRQVVEELLSGQSNINQLARKHLLSKGLISAWREKYLKGELEHDTDNSEQDLKRRVRELERMVGRLTLDNELLKKALVYLPERLENTGFQPSDPEKPLAFRGPTVAGLPHFSTSI